MLCIWNTRITCFQCIVIKYACIFMNKYVSFSKSWVLFSGENFISWTYSFFGQRLKWIQPWILTMEINNKMCMPAWAHIYVVVFFWCEFSGSGIDSNTFYMYYRTYNIYNKNASVSRSLCVCVCTLYRHCDVLYVCCYKLKQCQSICFRVSEMSLELLFFARFCCH